VTFDPIGATTRIALWCSQAKEANVQIVVGVDGSKGSRTALEWALDEARLRKSKVTVITAWSPVMTGYIAVPAPFVDPNLFEEAAHQTVQHALEDVDTTGLSVETKVVSGSAGQALTAASETADLVVVGSRGYGGFTGLLLGSTSQQVAHHAHCPVVIVPGHS
jgi:nucleotide-binding universal stress UspA family protein